MENKEQDFSIAEQISIDLIDCNHAFLNDETFLRELIVRMINMADLHCIKVVSHQFQPYGVTVLAVIAESHISIHTWPEYDYTAVDIFTCGSPLKKREIISFVVESFEAKKFDVSRLRRGMLHSRELIQHERLTENKTE